MQKKCLPFPFQLYCLNPLAYSNSELTSERMKCFRYLVGSLDGGSAHRRAQKHRKGRRHTSMLRDGLEFTIQIFEWSQSIRHVTPRGHWCQHTFLLQWNIYKPTVWVRDDHWLIPEVNYTHRASSNFGRDICYPEWGFSYFSLAPPGTPLSLPFKSFSIHHSPVILDSFVKRHKTLG
jgi:hypothetical protein